MDTDRKAGEDLKKGLVCKSYEIHREEGKYVRLDMSFVVPVPSHLYVEIAEILKRLELLLADRVNLVAAAEKRRCSFCGILSDDGMEKCAVCGEALLPI